jgi:hypothetical protein
LGALLLCVVQMRRREPPFIDGEEGGLCKRLHPHKASFKPISRYIESARHPVNRLGDVGLNRLDEVGLEAGHQGRPHPRWAPLSQFGWIASLDLLDLVHDGAAQS